MYKLTCLVLQLGQWKQGISLVNCSSFCLSRSSWYTICEHGKNVLLVLCFSQYAKKYIYISNATTNKHLRGLSRTLATRFIKLSNLVSFFSGLANFTLLLFCFGITGRCLFAFRLWHCCRFYRYYQYKTTTHPPPTLFLRKMTRNSHRSRWSASNRFAIVLEIGRIATRYGGGADYDGRMHSMRVDDDDGVDCAENWWRWSC